MQFKAEMDIRSSNDNLGIDKLLVESRVLTILVGGGNEGVTLVLKPFPNAELVLSCTKQLRDLNGGRFLLVSIFDTSFLKLQIVFLVTSTIVLFFSTSPTLVFQFSTAASLLAILAFELLCYSFGISWAAMSLPFLCLFRLFLSLFFFSHHTFASIFVLHKETGRVTEKHKSYRHQTAEAGVGLLSLDIPTEHCRYDPS